MGIELGNVFQAFASSAINYGNTALVVSTISHIDFLFCRIISDIVGILSDVNGIQQLERISIVDSELSICTVRDKKPVELTHVHHTLRCRGAGDAVHVPA